MPAWKTINHFPTVVSSTSSKFNLLVEGMEGSLPGSEEGVPVEEVPDVCDADSGRPRDWQQVLAVAGQHTFKKLFREAFKIIHRYQSKNVHQAVQSICKKAREKSI